MTDLGKIGITPRKAWVSETIYERLDLVSHKGAAYLALKETNVEPVDDNINWMLIAEGIDSSGVEDIVDAKIATLSDVAISGAYGDLIGTPSALPADGGNADTVDGFHVSKENTADTVVARGADGSIHVGAIISDTEDSETVGLSQLIGVNGADGRYRRYSINTVKANIGNSYIQTNRLFAGRPRSASSNTIKYVRFLRVNTGRYAPYPMIFKIANRSNGYIKVALSFVDISSYDPGIKLFQCAKFGTTKGGVYIARAGVSTWDLYVDAGDYDALSYSGDNLPDFGLVQCDEVVRSLPDGYIVATEVTSMP